MSTITVTLETVTDDERRIEQQEASRDFPDEHAMQAYRFMRASLLFVTGRSDTMHTTWNAAIEAVETELRAKCPSLDTNGYVTNMADVIRIVRSLKT